MWSRQNRKTPNPDESRVLVVISTVVLMTLTFIAVAIFAHPEDRPIDYHFYSERGLVTGLSAFFLAAASSFAIATSIGLTQDGDVHRWPWLLMAVGFMFLSLDETVQFHERVGSFIGDRFDSGGFRNWNDIIVLAYGAIALPILLKLFPAIKPFPVTMKLMGAAFVLYAIHTGIDSTQSPPTPLSRILEESAKLLCGAMLALSMFFGFYRSKPSSGQSTD